MSFQGLNKVKRQNFDFVFSMWEIVWVVIMAKEFFIREQSVSREITIEYVLCQLFIPPNGRQIPMKAIAR